MNARNIRQNEMTLENITQTGLLWRGLRMDAHCHTTLSDGLDTPAELVRKAVSRKLDLVIVTDHDRVNREARKLLREVGIASLDGVEISAKDYDANHSLHVLFYADSISSRTEQVLAAVRSGREEKVRRQCELLNKNGFPIDFPQLIVHAERSRIGVDCLTNGHISQFLLQSEDARKRAAEIAGRPIETKTDFIWAFLKEKSDFPEIGHVQVAEYEPGIGEIAALAKRDGGLLSVAHPNFSFSRYGWLSAFEDRMRRYSQEGIRGIELNSFAPPEWVEVSQRIARECGLILTRGSDSHGVSDERHKELGDILEVA